MPTTGQQDGLTSEQWGILAALADTVAASLTPLDGNRLLQHPLSAPEYETTYRRIEEIVGNNDDDKLVQQYLAENATANPEFRASLINLVNTQMNEEAKKGFLFILNALNTRAGALLFTGHATPMDCLPVATRQEILKGWTTSRLQFFRALHTSLTAVAKSYWIRTSPTLSKIIDYPADPVHNPPPGTPYPFDFLQFPASSLSEPEVITADVVIVGSGCGGAVAAKTLAESGLKVLIVDKSYYWRPDQMPMTEGDGVKRLFENGGVIMSDDSSISVVAGSTWGGGGTINWSASLQPQSFVRREWSEKFGLPHFTTAAFQDDLDQVCGRMGVGTSAIEHNKTNQVLLEGARKLGFSAKVVPQNTGGEAHNCGRCTLGCGSSGKKGPTETWLPDAAKAGARFIEGFEVAEVTFDKKLDGSDRVATGVRGKWTSRDSNGGIDGPDRQTREVVIKASRVISSGGTLASPLLLKRSGLTNPHIGRHLHLHPASLFAVVWDEVVRPWEGPILTSVVSEFDNLSGDGYGSKLEACTMIPGFFLSAFPWRDGAQFKEFAAKMKRMTGYISLARDRYGGEVFPDPVDGRCRIKYNPSKYDRAHALEGLVGLAQIAYIEGAREIHTVIPGLEPFIRPADEPASKITVSRTEKPSISDPDFQAWLAKLYKVGLGEAGFASAHQMGTARMGSSPANSAIGPDGQVWGTKGLFVCDASAFPSASGVNPMITVMAMSRGTARGIAEGMGSQTGTTGMSKL